MFALDYPSAHRIFFSEPLFDLKRKWALFEGAEIVSILTTTPLEFGWGRACGVAGVATREDRRGEGLAGSLLTAALDAAGREGESVALLFARETRLYERLGFEPVDRIVRAEIVTDGRPCDEPSPAEVVTTRYTAWAEESPERLRRDDRRWGYWHWHGRRATPFRDGYLLVERDALRECVFSGGADSLPLPAGAEWFGSERLAVSLGLPLGPGHLELHHMARGRSSAPELFMTDQF